MAILPVGKIVTWRMANSKDWLVKSKQGGTAWRPLGRSYPAICYPLFASCHSLFAIRYSPFAISQNCAPFPDMLRSLGVFFH
jgi:hypothetical protein